MSALSPEADMFIVGIDVRYVPLTDIAPAKFRYSPGPFVGDSFSITLSRLNEAGF